MHLAEQLSIAQEDPKAVKPTIDWGVWRKRRKERKKRCSLEHEAGCHEEGGDLAVTGTRCRGQSPPVTSLMTNLGEIQWVDGSSPPSEPLSLSFWWVSVWFVFFLRSKRYYCQEPPLLSPRVEFLTEFLLKWLKAYITDENCKWCVTNYDTLFF